MTDYTFKELDELHGCVKGTAFRAFKRAAGELVEGEDFLYLDGEARSAEVAALRAGGRLYRSSVHAVLITRSGYARLRDRIAALREEGCPVPGGRVAP